VPTPSDSDEHVPPSGEEPQGSGLGVDQISIPAPTVPVGDHLEPPPDDRRDSSPGPAVAGTPETCSSSLGGAPPGSLPTASSHLEAATPLTTYRARKRRKVKRKDQFPIPPKPRNMDGTDFWTFLVGSRYATFNAVILVCVLAAAAVVIESHAGNGFTMRVTSPGFTLVFTSTGTVIVATAAALVTTFGARAVRRRRARRTSQSDGGPGEEKPEATSPPPK
jgi:hypothetical protein